MRIDRPLTAAAAAVTITLVAVSGVAETFSPDGLQTVAGDKLPADLVVYATGFDRRYDYLPAEVLKDLNQTDEGIPLYRDTLPTHVQASSLLSGTSRSSPLVHQHVWQPSCSCTIVDCFQGTASTLTGQAQLSELCHLNA